MSISGLWPRQQSRPTASEAEQRVYEALSRTLPKGWAAWHSLRIRTEHGLEGEGDFVLAVPGRGFVVLEVKGGALEVRDGRWFQNGRPLDKAPREQAHGFAKNLLSRLKELGCLSVPFGILTIFPDTSFFCAPEQGDLRSLILGTQDLPWLGEAIASKLEQAFPENYQLPHQNWTALLHSLWGETWVPRLQLGQRARVEAQERLKLDQEQVRLIDALAANDRLLVAGTAGSGKIWARFLGGEDMADTKIAIDLLRVERSIRSIRGDKVILDEDLAELYGVEVRRLNEQVRRNITRFPADFMFQLTNQEFKDLKSQIVTSSQWGGRRTPPYAFSEQGVAMLSSVLHSPRAVQEEQTRIEMIPHSVGRLLHPLFSTEKERVNV